MASLDDLLIQLGLAPQPPPLAPATAPPSYTPYDSSVVPGTAFGAPYPGGFPAADTGATDGGGYTPQPRADLPRPLTKGPGSDMFGGYRNLYDPAAAEQDPVAALMASLGQTPSGPGFPDQTPPSRALTPQWAGRQDTPQYGAQQDVMTHGERTLMDRHPAYGPAIARIRALDRLRAQKGI